MSSRERDLARIRDALHAASTALQRHLGAPIEYTIKHGHGPVTAADHELDALLRTTLPEAGEGWLSEETVDDAARLSCRRVWIVDPIDGTRSLVAGRPEYSISIALVEDGEPVLGGVCNPASGVTVVGGPEVGLTVEGAPQLTFPGRARDGALRVLASRSECRSGEWDRWLASGEVDVLPISSVAYKLALVAAGFADATWTVWPKSEWDVAAGMALVRASGGAVWAPGGGVPLLNRPRPQFDGFGGASAGCLERVRNVLADGIPPR